MNDLIQLGPITIFIPSALTFCLPILTYFWTYLFCNRYNDEHSSTLPGKWFEAWLIVYAIWKFSYILIHPVKAIENPLTILYFSGGTIGLILGLIVGLLYFFIYTKRKGIQMEFVLSVLLSSAFFYSALYSFQYAFFYDMSQWRILFTQGVYFLIFATLLYNKQWSSNLGSQLRISFWYLVGYICFQLWLHDIKNQSLFVWGAFGIALVITIKDIKDGGPT
ncbi:hypothetical protein [Salirhabdus salicampi]|uniref:hypothetical protein n=1 Tax=Salirhabdus salicampi TaxID=476102 RepID=UPI0020C5B01B|nr:hypothetical protein [Salirhabdus salicampi]MCP8616412.1 hypothetical protein [Salirhabdus salicampi]